VPIYSSYGVYAFDAQARATTHSKKHQEAQEAPGTSIGGTTYWAVSDVEPAHLRELARLLMAKAR
jgi:hypothetical protein